MPSTPVAPNSAPSSADDSRPARRRGRGADSSRTKSDLVDAAFATLRDDGFRNASARTIASAAGCNQASIYYHFGGIEPLLTEALRSSSERRLDLYREQIGAIDDIDQLLERIDDLHRDDVASGHLTVMTELVGGITSQPDLRPGIVEAIRPWLEFVTERIQATVAGLDNPAAGPVALIPAEQLADLIFSMMIGIELHSKIDDDQARFTRAVNLGRLSLAAVQLGTPTPTTTS